jgi:hypothetical protein
MGVEHFHLSDVPTDHVVDEFLGLGAAHFHLPHVIDVEQASHLTRGVMLLEWAGGVLDGHFPASEWYHATAMVNVPLIEMRAFQIFGHRKLLYTFYSLMVK